MAGFSSLPRTPREGRFSWAGLLWVLGLALLTLSWLLPNHYPPWATFHSDVVAFAAFGAFAFAAGAGAPAPVVRSLAPCVVLALAAVPVLQHACGLLSFHGDALLAVIFLAGLAGSLYLGLRQGSDEGVARKTVAGFAIAFAVAGCASTWLAIVQWLRMEEIMGIFIANIGESQRPFANFGQPNLFGTLVVMAVASTALLYEQRKLGPAATAAIAFFLSLGLALAQSRAAFLAAGVTFAWWLLARPTTLRLRPAVALPWAAWFCACAAALPWLSVVLEFAGSRNTTLFDNNGRILMWRQVLAGIEEAPWTGYGWGQTAAAQMAGSVDHPGMLATIYAHNLPLDLAAWFGIPLGLVLMLAGSAWVIRRLLRAREATGFHALAIGLPVAVHSLVEFPFAYAYFLFPVALMAGVARGLETGASRSAPARARWLVPLAAAWLALAGAMAWEYVDVEEDFRFVRFESMRVGKTPESHVPPVLHLNDQMGSMLRVARIKPVPAMDDAAIEEARKVSRRFPWAPLSLRYAAVLLANGRTAEADAQMRVVRGMYGEAYYRSALERLEEVKAAAPRKP